MLRFLLRRPRTIRVPLQNGTVNLQRVKVTYKPKYGPDVLKGNLPTDLVQTHLLWPLCWRGHLFPRQCNCQTSAFLAHI